jgi:Ala-tRNA(Pro) deacylase
MNHGYEQELYDILDQLNITYKKIEHVSFGNTNVSGSFYQDNDMGIDCKNLFLQNRRGKKHYLVIICAYKKIDISHLALFLGENKKMGFASAERLKKYLGVTPGSVTPFGLIHDKEKEVHVVIDKNIFLHEHVHFHPLRNTASLKITTTDLKVFLENSGCKVHLYET